MTAEVMTSRQWWAGLAGVLILAAIVFALPAGRRPFWSSDEARFAILAQDILDHGRWLVPHLRDDLYLNKPQLYFWSIALVSLPVGRVTELTAAIPSVVSAWATVAAVVAIGRLAWGPAVGLLAGLVLIATPPYFAFGHAVLSDVMMTAFMTWAVYFLLRAQHGSGGTSSLLAFYACVAAAVLAKGPAGLAVLLAGVVATMITRGSAGLAALKPLHGAAVLAVAATVWFAPYLVQSEGRFVSRVLVGHYTTWYLAGAPGSRLRQLGVLLRNFLPWTVLLAAAVASWPPRPDPARRWLAVIVLVLTVVLVLTGHQRARYLLPIYPVLALLVAELVVRGGRDAGRRALRAGAAAFAMLAAGAAVMVPFLASTMQGDDRAYLPGSRAELTLLVALVLVAALGQALGAWRRAFVAGTVTAALAIAAVMIVEGALYPIRYTRANDLRPLAAAAGRHTPVGTPVIVHPDARLAFDFYVRRPVLEAATPAAAAVLAARTGGAVVTTRKHWPELAAVLPSTARVTAAAEVGGREYVVIAP